MRTAEAVKHFGTKSAVADALGYTRGAVSLWGDLVPELSAMKLERITGGALTYRPEPYARKRRKH